MREQPTVPKRKHPKLGIWLSAIYLVIVLAVYIVSAITTTPDKVGYDWIPFWSLALPWSAKSAQLLLPGFLINALLLCLLGTVLQSLGQRVSAR
jgi:hypothetical protein